jgi:hypothetical protein
LIAAGSAILIGVWNTVRVGRLERMRSELAREETAMKAKVDYEYDARRRLYERFEPALFQLLELAEFAVERIQELTNARIWSELIPAEDEPSTPRPRMVKPTYAAVATVYGLFAPLVVVRHMSRQLTLVDLSLEARIQLQYFLAARLYGSFKDDFQLAAIDPAIPYDPRNPNWRRLRHSDPARYWWQGLTMGRLEGILDLLTVPDESASGGRLASFGEFEVLWHDSVANEDERRCKTLAVASNALLNFRPQERPVFWRVLIAQARLYQALVRTRADGFSVPTSLEAWDALLSLEDPASFDCSRDIPDAPRIAETIDVTSRYLRAAIAKGYRRQVPSSALERG